MGTKFGVKAANFLIEKCLASMTDDGTITIIIMYNPLQKFMSSDATL